MPNTATGSVERRAWASAVKVGRKACEASSGPVAAARALARSARRVELAASARWRAAARVSVVVSPDAPCPMSDSIIAISICMRHDFYACRPGSPSSIALANAGQDVVDFGLDHAIQHVHAIPA